jgi:hypothetical protein
MQMILRAAAAAALAFHLGASAQASTLSDGLVAYWPFDGNADDASGNGNDGAVSGAMLVPDRNGAADSAYSFDGVDDAIGIGSGVKPALPLTANLWLNQSSNGLFVLFRNDQIDGGSSRYGIGLSTDGSELALQLFSGFSVINTRKGVVTTGGQISLGSWTMFTAVAAGLNDLRLYVNGSPAPTVATTGTGNSFLYSGAPGAIGQVNDTPNNNIVFTSTTFDGLIDDVGVWDRALTDDEIEALYRGECVVCSTTPVPAPATLPLLATALGLAGLYRRLRT